MGAPDFSQHERLKSKLEEWADWMQAYRPSLGTGSGCFISTGSHDFESLFNGVEKQVMRAIEAAIDDLPPIQSAAIHRKYLHIQWRYPNENYGDVLDKAHDQLLLMLPKRNVIL